MFWGTILPLTILLHQVENERLELIHHLMTLLQGGRLHLAPIGNNARVLDVGTGTGRWAIEMGRFNYFYTFLLLVK
jgi:hypothetical protein